MLFALWQPGWLQKVVIRGLTSADQVLATVSQAPVVLLLSPSLLQDTRIVTIPEIDKRQYSTEK